MRMNSNVDVAVIGAGPAGLQWGLLLAKTSLSFVILESETSAGAFFQRFPRNRKLISHNKCNIGGDISDDDFRMRHDWHTLLEGTSFCDMDHTFYPHADTYVRYLQNVAHTLNVIYKAPVDRVEYTRAKHAVVHLADARRVVAHVAVIVATGLHPRTSMYPLSYATFPNLDSRDEHSFCKNKRVGIIGGGNAAYETADLLKTCAESVHIFTRRPSKMAALTHYPGGVRMQYMGVMDRYMLKSLDTIEVTSDATLQESCLPDGTCSNRHADVLIYCGGFEGFRSNLVTGMNQSTGNRFPETIAFYGIPESHGMGWFAGALMHGRDYRRSAGGFVHGFRYLIRAQFRYFQARLQAPMSIAAGWEGSITAERSAMIALGTHRMQTSSGLYQMQRWLVDLFVRATPPSSASFEARDALPLYRHIPEVPHIWTAHVIGMVPSCHLGFGYNESVDWTLESALENRNVKQSPPLFLHPYIVHLPSKKTWHIREDRNARWQRRYDVQLLETYLTECLESLSLYPHTDSY